MAKAKPIVLFSMVNPHFNYTNHNNNNNSICLHFSEVHRIIIYYYSSKNNNPKRLYIDLLVFNRA